MVGAGSDWFRGGMRGTAPDGFGGSAAVVTAIDLRPAPGGGLTVEVTMTDPGGRRWTRSALEQGDPRELARSIAARHDLVPIWRDLEWVTGNRPRPPADRYERRG